MIEHVCIYIESGSSRLEQQDSYLSQVEVDEVLRFVCYVRSEVPSNDTVPRRVVLFVELFLDVGCDVLLDVELLHGLRGAVDCLLLHILRHVSILNDCFAFRHSRTQLIHLNKKKQILQFVKFALLLLKAPIYVT